MKSTVRKASVLFLTSLIVVSNFCGCASILHGSTDKVSFEAKPEGTKVYIDGALMGTVPLALELKSNKDYRVEFRSPGHESRTVMLNSSVGAGWVVVDVLFGLVPVIVDAATGNWNSLDQTNLNVELEKQK